MMFGSRDGRDVILRDEAGNATAVATLTPLQGTDAGESTVADAEDILTTEFGKQDAPAPPDVDDPESSPDYSMLSLAVDADRLDADNPVDYMVLLLLEGKRYDGTWDGDEQQVAQWAVAQWCQEVGWVPDLRNYEAGEQVGRGDEIACLDTAFYGRTDSSKGDSNAG